MKAKHKSYLLVNFARASTLLVLMCAWPAAAQDSPGYFATRQADV
jgi:hypothetical protein